MISKINLPIYNHLIIIGNGFDLNLGLPTSYERFLKSTHFQKIHIKEGRSNYNWICKLLIEKSNLNNWIDVENELKEISKLLYESKNFKSDFLELKQALVSYLADNVESTELNTNSIAYQFIQGINISKSLIIDFNYTDTISKVLKATNRISDKDINSRVLKIHGSWKNNDIILGVEDGAEIADGHHFLQKANHLNYVGFNLQRLLKDINKLTVFGHSLGPTDQMYFKPFFEEKSRPLDNPGEGVFELYHFGQESFDSIMGNIRNLTNDNNSRFRQNLIFKPIDSSK